MSTAPAASTPALRKLHGSPTWLGSSAMNGAGDGVPGSGWPTVVWRRNATPARRRAANVASSSGGGGATSPRGSMPIRTATVGSFWAECSRRK